MLQKLKGYQLWSVVNGTKIPSTIDTGATSSVIAAHHVRNQEVNKNDIRPIRVGDGHVQWTEGSTWVEVMVGHHKILQRCLIMETTGFDLVLGMAFLHSEHNVDVKILIYPHPRLILDGEEHPLEEITEECTLLRKIFRTESYSLDPKIRSKALGDLGLPGGCSFVLFAEHCNASEEKYITKKMNAWKYD